MLPHDASGIRMALPLPGSGSETARELISPVGDTATAVGRARCSRRRRYRGALISGELAGTIAASGATALSWAKTRVTNAAAGAPTQHRAEIDKPSSGRGCSGRSKSLFNSYSAR